MTRDSDIRVLELNFDYKTYRLRTPLKFGSVVVNSSTSIIVKATVENRLGKKAEGLGSMPLAHEWAFPSSKVSPEKKLEAMKLVAESYGKLLISESNKYLHPIDWFIKLEEDIPKITRKVSQELNLEEQLPILASLVAVSPIDASLHDGFGKANEICSYDGYSAKYVSNDLSFYLGSRFKGKYISDYIKLSYSDELPVFHLVGGLDKLWKDESSKESEGTLPLSLEEWIEKEGIFCFKIKLKGNDIEWDLNRTKEVTEVIVETLKKQGRKEFYLSVDSNEMHPSPEAVLEYLRRVKKEVPLAFERMLYIEQPVSRDLEKYMFDMSKVAKVKPVLADEGVTSIKDFDLAISLGWSGVALKTCKTHSTALLLVAKAEELKVPYSIQDLTLPGLALVHSAGFAARTNPIMGFEYNARQYLPFAFAEIQNKYHEIFKVKEGKIRTGTLNGTIGLGLSL